MDIVGFLQKYDNHAGDPWIRCASTETQHITEAEVNSVGDYNDLIFDYITMDQEDRAIASKYFDEDVVYEVLIRIDPKYIKFHDIFDNGTGLTSTSGDNNYTLEEIIAGGRFVFFQTRMHEMNDFVQETVLSRTSEDAQEIIEKEIEELFWTDYDNGAGNATNLGNGKISKEEIEKVRGWDGFVKDISVVTTDEAIDVLERLTDLPPPAILHELSLMLPQYVNAYNMRQFGSVSNKEFDSARKGLALLESITRTSLDEVSTKSLPILKIDLPVNSAELIYSMVRNELERNGADGKMTLHQLAQISQRYMETPPNTNVAEIVQCLNKDEKRYLNAKFSAEIKGKFAYDIEEPAGTISIRVDDVPENQNIIEALIYRSQLKFEYHRALLDTSWKYDTGYYTIEIPQTKLVIMAMVSDQKNLPIRMTILMPQFNIDLEKKKIYLQRLNQKDLNRTLQEGFTIEVMPVTPKEPIRLMPTKGKAPVRWILETDLTGTHANKFIERTAI